MRWYHQISSGIIALAMLFVLSGGSQPQVPQGSVAHAGNPYPYPVISETDSQRFPALEFHLSFETAEEYWGCEYMMELPGTCIMTV